jgi:hypothetical protein
VVISEVRPTKDKDDFNIGYNFYPVSQQWFLMLKEAINAAETALNSSLVSGFNEVSADTSAGKLTPVENGNSVRRIVRPRMCGGNNAERNHALQQETAA